MVVLEELYTFVFEVVVHLLPRRSILHLSLLGLPLLSATGKGFGVGMPDGAPLGGATVNVYIKGVFAGKSLTGIDGYGTAEFPEHLPIGNIQRKRVFHK